MKTVEQLVFRAIVVGSIIFPLAAFFLLLAYAFGWLSIRHSLHRNYIDIYILIMLPLVLALATIFLRSIRAHFFSSLSMVSVLCFTGSMLLSSALGGFVYVFVTASI